MTYSNQQMKRWELFAAAALSGACNAELPEEVTAASAARTADYMMREYAKRARNPTEEDAPVKRSFHQRRQHQPRQNSQQRPKFRLSPRRRRPVVINQAHHYAENHHQERDNRTST